MTIDLSTLQEDVTGWANEQFPGQPKWVPAMLAWEEYGELVEANNGFVPSGSNRDATMDAVGDIVVCLAHYTGEQGYTFPPSSLDGPEIIQPHAEPIDVYAMNAGRLTRSIIKQEQGIRLSEERVGRRAEQAAIAGMLGALIEHSWDHGFDIEDATSRAWGEVSEREWDSSYQTTE